MTIKQVYIAYDGKEPPMAEQWKYCPCRDRILRWRFKKMRTFLTHIPRRDLRVCPCPRAFKDSHGTK